MNDDHAERDIAGNRIFRATADLTKRLSKEFRMSTSRCCFRLHTAEEAASQLAEVRSRKIIGRTERARERSAKARAKYIVELETRLRLAQEYEAETAHLRIAAGAEAAKTRLRAAEHEMEALAERVSLERPWTMYGVRLQADVLIYTMERCRITEKSGGIFGETMRLACNLMDATVHLDCNGAGAA